MGTLAGILLVGALLAYGLFWLAMLREIAIRPDEMYRQVGESKAIWFLVVLVLQFFGTLAYYFLVRPRLAQADKNRKKQLPV